MKDLSKTWLDVFMQCFVKGNEVSRVGVMKWVELNEFEASVENPSAYIRRYEIDKNMETADVYLTPEMVKCLENEINRNK